MSVIWSVSGWALWCLVAGAAILGWAKISSAVAAGETVYSLDAAPVLALTLLASWFYVMAEWDKLHLLWLVPLLYGIPSFFGLTRNAVSD
jgi:hypothetical protein